MSNLLALETSTDACSVALQCGDQVLARHHVEPRAHNRMLLQLIDELMAEAALVPTQLDGLAFGRGPGSFTGLRIAAAVTQGISWAADVPVVAVSTLEILAATALASSEHRLAGVCTLVDARMGECYWNGYRRLADGRLQPLTTDRLVSPETLAEQVELIAEGERGSWAWAGSGLLAFPDLPLLSGWPGPQWAELLPDARQLLALAGARLAAGEGRPAAEAIPHYLRDERRWRRMDQAGAGP